MPAKVPFPIKFKPLFKGVHFALKDISGKLIDDEMFPFCSYFSGHIAYDTLAVCYSLLRSAGKRHGILEIIGLNGKVLQTIDFDNDIYLKWRKSN